MFRNRFLIPGTIVIALVAAVLYLPFLHNELVFDDYGLFADGAIYGYAQSLFNLLPRTFPYFTLGCVATLSNGSVEANRIFSLVLHISCAFMLYRILHALLTQAWAISAGSFADVRGKDSHIAVLSGIAACWFALHPIAVYGAAYLAQRTIIFATLFSLLSLWFYLSVFAENRTTNIITAALFYSLAVFSKEHAIMLPFAGVMLTVLFEGGWRTHWKRIVLYVGLCTPAALTVLFATRHLMGAGYEPDVAAMLARMSSIPIMVHPWGKWIVSVVVQTELFFVYIALWVVPDVHVLSADIRFDFVHIWFAWWSFPVTLLFFLSPLIALYFLRSKGLVKLFCCGFMYAWLLFLTEIVSVRFQEPFVLYRSYLWAPGYLMMLGAICARIPQRWLTLAAITILIACFLLARDRLHSFQDNAHLWKDAAAKLSSPTLLGSDRIFYNRGRAYLQEKRYPEAEVDFSRTIALSPRIYQAYYNRALAYYAQKEYPKALTDLDYASTINQQDASIPFLQGLVFESNGCVEAALRAYVMSRDLGNQIAKLKIQHWVERKDITENHEVTTNSVRCPA